MTTHEYVDAFLKGALPVAEALWPLWLMVGFLFAIPILVGIYRWIRIARSGLNDIDGMTGIEFERYVAFLFGRLGFDVQRTAAQGDYGADLVLSRRGKRTVVQAKRHRRSVGVRAVQEAVAAKGWYSCEEAMVVTNSTFTQQAVRLARRNRVELWDRNRLASAMASIGGRRTMSQAVEPLHSRESLTPVDSIAVCAVCGDGVSDKVRDYCIANAHRFGGRILCYHHQRTV